MENEHRASVGIIIRASRLGVGSYKLRAARTRRPRGGTNRSLSRAGNYVGLKRIARRELNLYDIIPINVKRALFSSQFNGINFALKSFV